MDAELGKFIAVFVMVILPIIYILWAIGRRFDSIDEEISELKNRINKNHNEQPHNDAEKKFYCEFRDCRVTCDKSCKNCLGSSVDEEGKFYCEYYKN